MLDLHAPVEPGKSAAGFEIGQLQSSIEPLLKDVRRVDYSPGFDLNAALSENRGALVLRNYGGTSDGDTIYIGSDVIRLCFSSDGRLGCIYVFGSFLGADKGLSYLGSYNGVSLGQPLSLLTGREEFEFDSGDEMYYRVGADGQYVAGLAVVALEADVSEHASTPVVGYSVHDWAIFKTRA